MKTLSQKQCVRRLRNEKLNLYIYEEFKKYVGNDIGKELEKAEEVDFELPPEL